MLKTAVLISLSLTLGACARSSDKSSDPQVKPAGPAMVECSANVNDAVAKVRGGNPEGATCKTLEDSVATGVAECASKGGEKLELNREIEKCAQTVVENQSRADEVEASAKPAIPLKVEPPKPDVLNVRSVKSRDRLEVRDWVYIPSRQAFGHVASGEGTAFLNQRVVALNGDLSSKSGVASVSMNEMILPAEEATLNVCDQSVKVGEDTLVSVKSGIIYKVVAAFDMKNRGQDGKVLLAPQVLPVGMWKFSLWKTLEDDSVPVLKDASLLTGVETKCFQGICVGDEVRPRGEVDPSSSYTVERVLCDGAAVIRATGYFGYADSVDRLSKFEKLAPPKTN